MHKRCITFLDRPFAYCHFENIQSLTTKPGLIRALSEYYTKTDMFRKAGYSVQHSMAMSFMIPVSDSIASSSLNQLKKVFKRIENHHAANESLPLKQMEKNMWIIKPENLNRGQGIEIASKFGEILSHIHGKQQSDLIVVQKYIEKPLLYNGRKFDIRVLALIDDEKNLWLYKPCYLRTSSDKYTLNSSSKYIHLTNNCF